MDEIIGKARVLIEALPYIQRFRDKYVVVKLGGSMINDRDCVAGIIQDVVFMEQVGMRPVLVLGGGPLVSAEMKSRGKEAVFVEGRRMTDEETLEIMEAVFVEQLLPWVAERIAGFGGRSEVFTHRSVSVVRAERSADEALGLVGEPAEVNAEAIEKACADCSIGVVGPLCRDGEGCLLNVNADHIASAVAGALNAAKIVFLSGVSGVLRDGDDNDSLISHLGRGEVDALVKDGTITAGMRPKVESCLRALDAGVRKAHIVDGRTPHSLLLEIFTDKGIGTEIVQ